MFDTLRHEPGLEEKVREIYNSRIDTIRELIDAAQKSGEIRAYIDSGHIAETISGMCREILLRWRLNRQSFSLRERTMAALGTLQDILG
jgi:hypothetical protein